MTNDQTLLVLIWGISIWAVALLVPRTYWCRFAVSFLLCQSLTWASVVLHVYMGTFTYPVREFPYATDMGFTMQYLFYPVVCGFYLMYEPEGTRIRHALYLLPWTLGLTVYHWILERYTGLIEYNGSQSFNVWLTATLIFAIVNITFKRFFRDHGAFAAEEELL